ncbi:MAG TPA: hypothetical protein VFR48_02905 [Solirubrobacteraceae bacterium]|nr:hypothetical protein [Solirubrobacteraceae bacterium]
MRSDPILRHVRHESSFDRTLWMAVLAAAIAIVLASFVRHPLFGGDGEASGFGRSLTVWVASGEAGSQTEAVAHQVAACWDLDGRSVSVGVLPGSPTSAVVDFLRRPHRAPDELLVVTSTTLSDIAHAEREAIAAETRERARQAARLLSNAPAVALIGSDPLTLAVRAGSPLDSTSALLSLLRAQSAQPLVGIAESSWLRGNLAVLAHSAGVEGQMPFSSFRSSREALASLGSSDVRVVLAPRSAVASDLHDGVAQVLSWPNTQAVSRRGATGAVPQAWMALLAPRGLSAAQLAGLHRQATSLCTPTTWGRMLRSDGLRPADGDSEVPRDFVRDSLGEAAQLQQLASRVVREY